MASAIAGMDVDGGMVGNWNGRGDGEVKRRKGEEEERGEEERG